MYKGPYRECLGPALKKKKNSTNLPDIIKVHLTPKLFFGRDETVQNSHKEFDNFISIWYF